MQCTHQSPPQYKKGGLAQIYIKNPATPQTKLSAIDTILVYFLFRVNVTKLQVNWNYSYTQCTHHLSYLRGETSYVACGHDNLTKLAAGKKYDIDYRRR